MRLCEAAGGSAPVAVTVMVRSILEPTSLRLGLAGVHLLVGNTGGLGSGSISVIYLLCDLGQATHLL